ncbi:hypothetical protein N7513_002636 [Penicillium frequentans]|nr:hypothetical protein N7513_002636 [Penicillium glabrum]
MNVESAARDARNLETTELDEKGGLGSNPRPSARHVAGSSINGVIFIVHRNVEETVSNEQPRLWSWVGPADKNHI